MPLRIFSLSYVCKSVQIHIHRIEIQQNLRSLSQIETEAREEERSVQGGCEKREFKGYEMVYYHVTRWGTKLWCLLTSYIEKYKVWRSMAKQR